MKDSKKFKAHPFRWERYTCPVGALHLVGASGMDDSYFRFAPLEYDSFERDDR